MQLQQSIFAILLIFGLGLWACQSEAPTSKKEASSTAIPSSSTNATPDNASNATPSTTASSGQVQQVSNRKVYSHAITEDKAQTSIAAYQTYVNSVNQNLVGENNGFSDAPSKLVYGAKVDRYELREILLNSNVGDELFAMMAIMPNDSTEIVFALKNETTNSWQYYDFTQPCPNACPNF